MKTLCTLIVLAGALSIAACQSQEEIANRGFSLPQGDADSGQAIFVEHGCVQCHTVAGTDFSGEEWFVEDAREITIELGGQTTKVQTYGDLVTSIINPSHRLAEGYPEEKLVDITLDGDVESKMYNYNDVMRVSDMIDIVTFLKTKYELKPTPLTDYPPYIYQGY